MVERANGGLEKEKRTREVEAGKNTVEPCGLASCGVGDLYV